MNQEVAIKIIFLLSTVIFSQSIPYFNSEKAYTYIVEQCEIGPRYPGSEGQKKFKNYLSNFLDKQKADTTIIYEHLIDHPYLDKQVKLYNFLSRFNLESNNISKLKFDVFNDLGIFSYIGVCSMGGALFYYEFGSILKRQI